jgi:hypothetical protein
MTTEPLVPKSLFADSALWVPVGAMLGSFVGRVFHDATSGASLGLAVGGVVTMLVERRQNKTPSWWLIGFSVFAVLVIVVTGVIERT